MALTPILISGAFKYVSSKYSAAPSQREPDLIDERNNPVILAGFGRFGQMVARLLRSTGVKVTVLDFDAEQVDVLRRFGMKAFYGDASQVDLLRAAGAEKAKLLILAIDNKDKTTEIVELAQKEFPNLKILARVYDRIHAYEMIHRGVDDVYIETAGSALNLGIDALRHLGFRSKHALQLAQNFKRHNDRSIRELAKLYHEVDEATYMTHSKNWLEALEKTLKTDADSIKTESDRAWESAPRREV